MVKTIYQLKNSNINFKCVFTYKIFKFFIHTDTLFVARDVKRYSISVYVFH